MEILKETLPNNPYPILIMAIGAFVLTVALFICSYVYKPLRKQYMEGVGFCMLITFVFFLLFIIISSTSCYTYEVLITDDNMFKELATRGYRLSEVYPGLGQKLYQVSGPIIDWLP